MEEDIPAELLAEYIESAKEKLGRMAQCLADPQHPDLDDFASLAHNFSGTGGVYGLKMVSDIGSRIEEAARYVLEGTIDLTPQVIEVLRLGVSALSDVFEKASSGRLAVTGDPAVAGFFAEMDNICKP